MCSGSLILNSTSTSLIFRPGPKQLGIALDGTYLHTHLSMSGSGGETAYLVFTIIFSVGGPLVDISPGALVQGTSNASTSMWRPS